MVAGDLQENFVWNYEFGFRGDPVPWLIWDTSFFMIDNSDQIGTRTADNGNLTIIENAGRSFVYGWDFFTQVDAIGIADYLFNRTTAGSSSAVSKNVKENVASSRRSWTDAYGSLYVYNALTVQSGEFIGGPNDGRTPQYLPDYVYRVGLIYNWRDRVKIAFMGTFIGASFADDTNTSSRFIPAYDVWDLTVEAKVYKDCVSIIGGVNNIFDRDYYARIRSDGIDPAMPRTCTRASRSPSKPTRLDPCPATCPRKSNRTSLRSRVSSFSRRRGSSGIRRRRRAYPLKHD